MNLAVTAGLHDGAGLARRLAAGIQDRGIPGVLLVGVAGEDRVDVGSGFVDQLGEGAAGCDFLLERGAVGRTGPGAVVVFHDDDVGELFAGDLRSNAVDGFHRIPELKLGDARRGDQRRHFLGDSADHGHLDAVHLQHRVLRQDRFRGALLVDVGAEVRELGVGPAGDDAVAQVRPAAVELVVAYRGRPQFEGVQHIDGGLVLGHGGGEE